MNELRPAFIRVSSGPEYNMSVYEEEGVGRHFHPGDKFNGGRCVVLCVSPDRMIYRVDDTERDQGIARAAEMGMTHAL